MINQNGSALSGYFVGYLGSSLFFFSAPVNSSKSEPTTWSTSPDLRSILSAEVLDWPVITH